MNHSKLVAFGLILTIGVFLAAGCLGEEEGQENKTEGKEESYPLTRKKVVNEYVKEYNKGNIDGVKKYLSSSAKKKWKELSSKEKQSFQDKMQKTKMEIQKVNYNKITGEETKATVKLKTTIKGESMTVKEKFSLEKKKGKWKITKGLKPI